MPQHRPLDFRVLQMHVVDLVGKVSRGLNRVHHLPHQMGRIVLQPDIWRVAETVEQRLETRRADREIRTPG